MPKSTKIILCIVAALSLVLFTGVLQYASPILTYGTPLALGALIGPSLFKVQKKWAVINGLLIGLLVDVAMGLYFLFQIVGSL
jgi:hypothetical protein